MSPRARLVATVAALAAILFAGTVTAAGVAAYREGSIRVAVHEADPEGTDFSIAVPAALVHGVVALVPDHVLPAVDPRVAEVVPVLEAICDDLERRPDFVLVETWDADEHVVVAKRGGSIVVEVEGPDGTVRVGFPVRTIRSVTGLVKAAVARGAASV